MDASSPTRGAIDAALASPNGAPAWRIWKARLHWSIKQYGPALTSLEEIQVRSGPVGAERALLRIVILGNGEQGWRSPATVDALRQLRVFDAPREQRIARLVSSGAYLTQTGLGELRSLKRGTPGNDFVSQLISENLIQNSRRGGASSAEIVAHCREATQWAPASPAALFWRGHAIHLLWSESRDPALASETLACLHQARGIDADATLWLYAGRALLTMASKPKLAIPEFRAAAARARRTNLDRVTVTAETWLVTALLQAERRGEALELARSLPPSSKRVARSIRPALTPSAWRELEQILEAR
ncbi:MAG: hypothetical protein JKY65_09595 [Planctomycetes bacterium]|nr:hypothetical protein [Planctomycetota bacterium]